MFRALTCPSSRGKIVFTQHLVCSHSVNVCPVHWLRADSKHVEDNSVTNILLTNKENCALKLVNEIILYYDAPSKNIKLQELLFLKTALTWHYLQSRCILFCATYERRFEASPQNCDKRLLAAPCLSVTPSVRNEQLGSHWTNFRGTEYFIIFRKSVDKIQVS